MNEETVTVGPAPWPWHRRLFEAVGGWLVRRGMPFGRLTEESLLRAARRRTRLDDFGADDFRVPLRVLVEDFENESDLSVLGRFGVRHTLVEGLMNRLRVEESLKHHPEVLDVAVRAPFFVVGMPRTGTTLLHNLLAQDPACRAPLLWELGNPWPLEKTRPGRPDPRIRQTHRRLAALQGLSPGAAAIHELHAEKPEECHYLFRNSMATQTFRAFADVPRFLRWKLTHDMLPEYRYYRRQLQLLLWQRPAEHLALKFPGHAWHLDTLLQVFPDARIVCTHRDPVDVAGSFCSMVALVRFAVSKQVDTIALGRVLTEELETGLQRLMASRERLDPSRFFDVRYDALVHDPVGVVGDVYRHFGAPLTEEMHRGMDDWIRSHRQHRHGKHVYHLSDYGLDADTLRDRFAAYWTRFGTP